MSIVVEKVVNTINQLRQLISRQPERFAIYETAKDPIIIDKETGIIYWVDEI
jgi:hypothetical protein